MVRLAVNAGAAIAGVVVVGIGCRYPETSSTNVDFPTPLPRPGR